MQLKELMTREIATIEPGATLCDAAEKMAALDIGFLPVAEQGHAPTGVVTDRDLVIRGLGTRRDPHTTHVRDIMTAALETLPAEADIEQAARLMQQRQIRRLLVTDKDGQIAGVVSLGDIATATGGGKTAEEVLKSVSTPVEQRSS